MFKAKIIRKAVKWNDANLRVYRIKEKSISDFKRCLKVLLESKYKINNSIKNAIVISKLVNLFTYSDVFNYYNKLEIYL